MTDKPEVWLQGPLDNIPVLLQPVAHALLQVREELDILMNNFPDELLWNKVAGMASPGFHLQHLTGVLDRIFTYARGEALTEQQLEYLTAEGKLADGITAIFLVEQFNQQVDKAITQLSTVNEAELTQFRGVGRAQLPSNTIGLFVHAAEHTTRHYGQLLVTVKVLRKGLG